MVGSVIAQLFLLPDTEITKDNLPDLMSLMQPVSNKWRDIGLQLKLKQQALDDIENNPNFVREGPAGFLRETLNLMKWPTVKTLLSALKTMKEDDIAHSIKKLTTKGQQPCVCHGNASV